MMDDNHPSPLPLPPISQRKPPRRAIKMNFGIAILNTNLIIDVVIRDCNGKLLDCWSKFFLGNNVKIGEVVALYFQ